MIKERRGIQSVEVGAQLLEVLVEEGAPMLLRELASKAGMTSAKAHPYLVSFGNVGLIQQDGATGRYELGSFALRMGMISLQLLDPVKLAIPEAADLCQQLGHTVGIAVLGNAGPTIIHLSESTQPVHVKMRTGTVMSILHTATGRVFSAHLPAMLVEKLNARELAAQVAIGRSKEKVSKQKLQALLGEVRKQGLARAVGEPIAGINALSAPVFDHAGNIALAVTAIGPMGTLDASWDGETAQQMRQCALRISQRLGYRL